MLPSDKGSSSISNEHFVPHLGNALQPYIESNDMNAVHHLIHYMWAQKTIEHLDIQPKSILDVACGSGFGSEMLAKKFTRAAVVGADFDEVAVEEARKLYANDNLTYKKGDVLQWEQTIGEQLQDCIVSFDTIEHIPHREIMMENVVRYLNPEGCLLLTTPCGHPENQLQPVWEHHDIEYSPRSLYDFLKRYFRVVLIPESKDFPGLEVFRPLLGTSIPYLLMCNPVVCLEPIRVESPFEDIKENFDEAVHRVTTLFEKD